MKSKLCGIDLNGVQDYVAKNWDIKVGEEYFSKNDEEIFLLMEASYHLIMIIKKDL